MEPIRVLQIGTRMHNNGGVEKYLIDLYRSIDKAKVQFDILSVDDGVEYFYEDEITSMGAKLYKIPDHTINFWLSFKSKIKVFKKYKNGIIHIHTTSGIRAIDGLLARLCGIRHVIFHSHSYIGTPPLKYKLTKVLFLLLGSYFFACSKEAGSYFFGKKIIKSKKFFLAKNAVSLDKFKFNEIARSKVRRELNIEGKQAIGFVGRFSPEKNILFLIDILEEISKIENDVVLVLVGDGCMESDIRKKVSAKKLTERVIFTGVRNDISDIMNSLDVLIIPSLNEGLGIVFIEAQATGLKCYASDAVPKETKVTNLIDYIGLEKTPKQWAEIICKSGFIYQHENTHLSLIKHGYELNTATSKIQELYLSLYK